MSELGEYSALPERGFEAALAGLTRKAGLTPEDAQQLHALVCELERYPAGAVLNSLAPSPRMKWVIAGWACEMRVLPDSRRQIFSFQMPGDVLLCRPAHDACAVVALTRLECIDVAQMLGPRRDRGRAGLWAAMTAALAVNEERKYDHILRLGQHTAAERLVHLLLELRDRLAEIGMAEEHSFRLPLTQEHLADALGLSVVHVNRTLKVLRTRGLVEFRLGKVTLLRSEKLAALGGREPAAAEA